MDPVFVLRLDALRLVRYAATGTLAALTPGGELLATVAAPDADAGPAAEREAFLDLFDLVLARGRVRRLLAGEGGVPVMARLPVLLYNPHSAEVACGPVPATRVFSDLEPLEVPAGGVVAHLGDDALTLTASDESRVLPLRDPDAQSVMAAVAAHDIYS